MLQEIALIAVLLFILCLFVYSFLNNSKRWPNFLKKIRYRDDEVPANEPVFKEEPKEVYKGLEDQKEHNV